MKKQSLFFLLGLVLIIAGASFLSAGDPPHNEASGMTCASCHGQTLAEALGDSPFWKPGARDVTGYNRVCLRCHDDALPLGGPYGLPSGNPEEGPTVFTHIPEGTAIQCIDCHSYHDQDQIALGKQAANKAAFFIAQATGGLVEAGTLAGTTNIHFSGWSGSGYWATPENVAKKTTELSRGAQLVPDRDSRNRWQVYMILDVFTGADPYIVVKGTLTSAPRIGIFYGQSIKRLINGREVRFWDRTGSNSFADASIGKGVCQVCHTYDLTSAAGVKYWAYDGTGILRGTGHNPGTNCMVCHNHSTDPGSGGGFAPGANHATFIVDDSSPIGGTNCSSCHTGYAASPESSHSACAVCHDAIPALFDSTFPTYDGQIDDDGNSMFTNLANKGYLSLAVGPITDASFRVISDPAFTDIKCGFCHAAKPNALDAAEHGGHASNHFVWNGTCQNCHGAGSGAESVVTIIHGDNCDLCHTGGTYNASTNGIGAAAAANGIDGDAAGAEGDAGTWTKGCTDCHAVGVGTVNALSLGGIHHDNATIVVANGLTDDGTICATCHGVTGHEGNHTNRVAVETGSCSVCHTGTNGNATGVPIDAGDAKVHDTCGTCHQIAALPAANVALVTAPGTRGVTTMNDSTPLVTNDGGGVCTACHIAYAFTNHTHAHTTVTAVAPCSSCHTGDTISAVYVGSGNAGTHQNNCADCHNTLSGARVNGAFNAASYGSTAINVGDATVNGGTGGTCAQCHTTYFTTHTHTHLLTISAGCIDCHDDGTRTDTNASDAKTAPFIGSGEVHVTLGCATCHNVAVNGALQGSAVGAGATAGCVDCHITTAAKTWTEIHTADIGAGAGKVDHSDADTLVENVGNCSGCHANVAGSDGRNAITTPYYSSTLVNGKTEVHAAAGCGTCHTGLNNGGLRTSGLSKAQTVTSGNCQACHTANWDVIHTSAATTAATLTITHVGRVNADADASCTACHTGTAATSTNGVGLPLAGGDVKVHDNCLTCHNNPDGALKTTPTANGWTVAVTAGTCDTCHDTAGIPDYFESHVHGGTGGYVEHVVTYTGADVSQATSRGCGECHDDAVLGKGVFGVGSALTTWASIKTEHFSDCATCHTYPAGTTPPFATNNAVIAAGAAATCISCHTPKIAPAEHGGHPDTHFGWGAAGCENCHGAGAAAEAVVREIHGNTCDTCHTNPTGTYDATSEGVGANGDGNAFLANGAAAAGTPFNSAVYVCATCHNQTDVAGFHGITIAQATSSHQLSSSSSGGYNCETCHSTNVANEQLVTHMGATDTPAQCATICHNNTTGSGGAAPTTAKEEIDAVTWLVGANPNASKCEDCHIAKGDYRRHGLTDDTGTDGVATEHNNLDVSTSVAVDETNCAQCHNLTSPTTRLQMHTQPLSGDPNNCLTCHNAGGAAQTAIDAGKSSAGAPAAQKCEACHAAKGDYTRHGLTDDAGSDGVVDVHDQLMNQTGAATSTCSNCHSAAAQINRLQLHTRAPITPTTCLTCHQSGAPVSTVIAAGWGTANAAQCDECHTAIGADWTVHNVDHSVSGNSWVLADTNCTACHDGNPGTNTTAPNSVASPYVGATENHNPAGCYTCHDNAGIPTRGNYLIIGAANVKGFVYAMPSSGGDCSACHIAWSSLHSHAITDFASDGTAEATCSSACHSFTGGVVQTTHGNTCTLCHDGTTYQTKVGNSITHDDWTGAKGDATKASDTSATCLTCHNLTGGTPYDKSEIHHQMGSAGPADTGDCTSQCHLPFLYPHDHSTRVSAATTSATCAVCHTATAGDTDTVPVDWSEGIPAAGDNKVHDECRTCHNADANGTLKAPYGYASAMPAGGGECDACHGAYFDSHVRGTANQSGTGYVWHDLTYTPGVDLSQAAPGTPCASCHTPVGALTTWTGIVNEHSGACGTCHSYATNGNQTGDPDTPLLATVTSTISTGTGNTCLSCHVPKIQPNTHGYYDHATNPGGGLAYAPMTKTASCTDNCHAGEVVVTLHNNVCTVCHTTAPTLKSTPNLAQFAGTTTACIDCHKDSLDLDGAGPYVYHGISYAHSETLTRHNNLSDSDSSLTYDCQACHTDMSTTTLKLQKHMATDTVADCYRCHYPNVWGGLSDAPAQARIAAGKGAGSAQTCEDCHTARNIYRLHGLTAADVATDNEHNNLTTSGIAGDTNCANCHVMTSETTKMNLHMSPKNTLHTGDCLTCHTAGGTAAAVINAGKSGGGNAAQYCNGCHAAKDDYLLHGLASNTVNDFHDSLSFSANEGSGTQTDCANCHTMATVQNRIDLHLAPTCSTCHTATGTAVTVIENGWNLGTTVNCESCHTAKGAYLRHGLTDDNGGDGVVDAHDQFNIQTGSATSTCSAAACHNTTAVNDIATMQLHTRAVTPTTCLTCHQSGAPVSTVIAAGWGSANPAQCDECHTTLGTDWYTHNVDHTASGMNAVLPQPAGASRTVSCSSTNCHAAQGNIITGVHDIYAPTGGSEPCKECHNAAGALINGNNGYGDARLGAGGGATCSTCHTSGFNIHLHNHDAKVTYNATVDKSQAAPGTACNICHGQGGASPYSLSTWANKLYEHDFVNAPQDGVGACTSCHDYDTRGNQTGDANTPVTATVIGAINNNSAVTCIGCHTVKVQPNAHGGHANAHFGWDSTCQTCHATTNNYVVQEVHKNNCNLCHSGAPDRTNEKLGNSFGARSPLGDARIANGTAAAGTWTTPKCTTCHPLATYVPRTIHHNTTTNSYAVNGQCIGCHKPNIGQGASTRTIASTGNIAMPRNLPCNLCHLYFAGWANDLSGGYETDASARVKIFDTRFNPNTNNGRLPTVTALVSHTISKNTTTPISDYAACFSCHGATGAGTVGDNTNNAGADRVGPFHGLGVPYAGDSNASGGDANDVINAYSGPQVAMVWGADSTTNNPVKSVPFHPGWNALNWLACEVGYVCGSTKPYAYDVSPGWHKDDRGLRNPASSKPCSTGSFSIPWDNYAAATPAAPQSISKNFGLKGVSSKSTIVPLVALNLSCTLPTNSLKTIRSGTGSDGNKNGDLSLGGYAYVDLNAPYPASAKNNGTVTSVDFNTIVNGPGTLTIFTCEAVTATSCTVTARGDYSINSGVNTLSTGLTIKPGGVVGYWVNTVGGSTTPDKSNSVISHPSATGAIKRTAGTVAKPPVSSAVIYAADPTGNFANFGATITTLPY